MSETATPTAEPTDTTETRTSGERDTRPCWRKDIDGVHVVKVSGTFREMGRQHGELLKDEIPNGPMPYFRTYTEKLIGNSQLGPLKPLVWPLIKTLVGKRIEKKIPSYARETLEGLAEGAELPVDQVLEGAVMPDSILCLVSRMIQMKRCGDAIDHRLALGLGCSSAVAWGDSTKDGKLYHARNFDYHGVESWTRTTTVLFHEPKEGHRYVSVCAAGVPMGGVTAMNAAGLTLTVHQHMFTDSSRLGGIPTGIVGDRVMREASNLDEAEKILREHTPIGCWTYVVTDGNTNEVLCLEENPQRKASIRIGTEKGHFSYANIYLDSELGKTEKNLYGSYWRHNKARHERLNAMLEEHKGEIDGDTMASILGDTGTTDCRIHNAIGMLMTVGSVVFRPQDGIFWIGVGEAPTSKRRFQAFDLNGECVAEEIADLVGGIEEDEATAEAFDAYRESYLETFDRGNLDAGRERLDHAVTKQPEQPLYRSVAGFLALQAGEPEEALACFDKALELGHPDEERIAAFHGWRGRALDLLGRRDEAIKAYHQALALRHDPQLGRAAERGLRRPFTMRKAKRIAVDFAFADVVNP